MPNVIKLQAIGDQIAILFDDGSRRIAYPSIGGLWMLEPFGADIPDPEEPPIDPPIGGGGLHDYYTPVWGISDGGNAGWEAHRSYSRGGTDWPMPVGTEILAPANGTLVNYANIDGAGLKSILVLDVQNERKVAASNTLMNGVYRETQGGDWAFGWVMQHLSQQLPAGHYLQGQPIAISGNTGSTTGPHLHGHLLAAPASVGSARLDFMKFLA